MEHFYQLTSFNDIHQAKIDLFHNHMTLFEDNKIKVLKLIKLSSDWDNYDIFTDMKLNTLKLIDHDNLNYKLTTLKICNKLIEK